jgi:hypothetical protein
MKMEFYPHLRKCNGSGERSYFFDFRMIVGWGTLSSYCGEHDRVFLIQRCTAMSMMASGIGV